MNNETTSLFKRVTITLVIIAASFFLYNFLLSQNVKYFHVYNYYLIGFVFLVSAAILHFKRRAGMRFFSVLTWATTVYAGYTLILLLAGSLNPFFFLGLLFNAQAQISYGAQLLFLLGLLIYMHSTRKIFSGLRFTNGGAVDARLVVGNKLKKRARIGIILALIGFVVIGYIALQAATKVALDKADPSHGKSKELEAFLENKYGEKFALSNFSTTRQWRSSFESWQELKADARPAKNSDILFEIKGCVENCESSQKYSDTYVYEYWAYEQKPTVEKKLAEVYGTVPEYKIKIGLGYSGKKALPDGPPPSFKTILADSAYKPSIQVSTYQNGTFTKENIGQSEERTRVMTSFVRSLGVSSFSFSYVMKDPAPAPESVYRAPRGVNQSDVHCAESLSISEAKYSDMEKAVNLKKYYGKTCSYKTDTGSGGGVVRGTYPE